MKIIVSNKREEEIIESFREFLADYGIELMEQEDDKLSIEDQEYRYLQQHEYNFIRNGIMYADIEINHSTPEMVVPHYQFTGVCSVCFKQTEGTIDGNELDILEYERLMNSQSLECESCMLKGRENDY